MTHKNKSKYKTESIMLSLMKGPIPIEVVIIANEDIIITNEDVFVPKRYTDQNNKGKSRYF